jgi:hypothetical protein
MVILERVKRKERRWGILRGGSAKGENTTNENVVLGVGDEPVKRWGRDFCSGRKKSASVRFLSGNVGFLG